MSDLVPIRNSRLAGREVAGEMVLLSADDSTLLVLNDTATAIWRLADGRTPLANIAQGISREFAVDFDTALAHVRELARGLADAGALTLVEASPVESA